MKKLILLTIFLLASCVNTKKIETTETTTYYFIRHAEKDRSDTSNKNPNLTETGHKRAHKWAEVLKNVSFDAVYSTNYNRTKQTAQPIATKKHLEIIIYNPKELNSKAFKKTTQGKTVLVVGHSNTTPAFVNAVLKKEKYKDINDSNNSNLYIVTITNNVISDQLLFINL